MSINPYSRQDILVPTNRINNISVAVIGCGALGRQLIVQLLAMGIGRIIAVDYDIVDATNVVSQGYLPENVGHPKIDIIRSYDPDRVVTYNERFNKSRHIDHTIDVIFSCVDNMATRRQIKQCLPQCELLIDGRVGGEIIRIITAKRRHDYARTLFTDNESSSAGCVQQSTIYVGTLAASLMVCQFVKHLKNQTSSESIFLDLSCDLYTTESLACQPTMEQSNA